VPPNRAIPLRIGLCPAVRRVLFDDGAKIGSGKQREISFFLYGQILTHVLVCARTVFWTPEMYGQNLPLFNFLYFFVLDWPLFEK